LFHTVATGTLLFVKMEERPALVPAVMDSQKSPVDTASDDFRDLVADSIEQARKL
jgi:hypothetical protein